MDHTSNKYVFLVTCVFCLYSLRSNDLSVTVYIHPQEKSENQILKKKRRKNPKPFSQEFIIGTPV